jgi:serine/threonine protein kinase
MAPEIVENENYDYGVDIWSLGILLYELLYGHSPFKANSTKNVILNIKSHEITYDDKNRNVSNSCKDLIKKLLNGNPQKRYKIKDILEHPFIKKHSEKYLSTFKKKSNSNLINEDGDGEGDNIFEIKRANTKYLTSKNHPKLFKFNLKNISPKMIPSASKKIFIKPRKLDFEQSPKKQKSSSKQLEILEKFNNSLQTQLEKAKKTIENMSFKNSKHCTFEDFRDSQFSSARKNTSKIHAFEQFKENIDINHPITIKKQISNKLNNFFSTKNNDEVFVTDFDTKNRSNSSKKSNVSKGIIIENDFEDIVEGEEQKAAIDRLNKAFERFGKENLNIKN